MIGENANLNDYLIKFNSSDWANKANAHLQNALNKGLQYSETYSKQALKAVQDYDQKAQNQMRQGFQRSQALDAPQHLATYNALDTYLGTLGQSTPVGGSFQLAKSMENASMGQPISPQQQQQTDGYNAGVQSGMPQGVLTPGLNPIPVSPVPTPRPIFGQAAPEYSNTGFTGLPGRLPSR